MTPLPAPRHLLFVSLFAAMPAAAQEASLLDAIVVSEKRALYRPEKPPALPARRRRWSAFRNRSRWCRAR
ncbi:hypothetical protein N8D55_00080 [Xanthomonas hortorum pv. pelargonii]|nr:hypothetical protein N8D55_00080 [Xanthomonas hortorum pv. pelargonii]